MNPSPLQWSLAVIGVLLFAISLNGQVVPHPYVTLEHTERLVDKLMLDGSVRRAEILLSTLYTQKLSAASDAVWHQQATVQSRSKQGVLADRTRRHFEVGRPNSPDVAFVLAERGLARLEQEQWSEAAAMLFDASELARNDYVARQAREYKTLVHYTLFWLGVARAESGLFTEAVQAFEQCTVADTVGEYADKAGFAIGQLYERNNNIDEAISAYNRVSKLHPRGCVVIASRIREAQLHLQKQNPERAVDVLVGSDELISADNANDTSVLQPQAFAEYATDEVRILRTAALLQRQRNREALDSARHFLLTTRNSPYTQLVFLQAGYAALHLDSSVIALTYLDSVLKDSTHSLLPAIQQARLYRAVALRKAGREDEAGEAFADLSSQSDYPFQAQALVELGQGAYLRNDAKGAGKILERAERASSDPTTTERARLLLGAVYVELQEWEKASDVYERAIQLAATATDQYLKLRHQYLAEARLKRGICLLQLNERDAAIRALTDYLGNHPKDPQRDEGTFWLAEAMYRNDLLKNAQELYEEIVNKFTASIRREEAMYGLAWTYFRKRDFDKSVRMFSKLLESYPKSNYATDALVRKGDGLYISRRYAEAAEQYRLAAQRAPSSNEGQYAGFQAGQAMYRSGNLDGASELLRRYASENRKSKLADDALYLSGWIAFQQNNDAGAIEQFSKLLSQYPDGDQAVRALYTMADAKYNLGDIQGAINTYKQVVEKYPSSPLAIDAGKSMQTALIGEGRTEEALAIADSWINANPTGQVAQEFAWEKANIFYTGRNYKSAADEFLAYLAKYPDGNRSDDALYHLGKSYLTMDDVAQSLRTFTDLEKKFPKSPFVVAAKKDFADYHRDQQRVRLADSVYAIVQTQFAADTASASRAGFERATIARQMLDTAKAVALYRGTANNYAGSEYGDQARYQLAMYYRGKRMPDSARDELIILVRTSPNAMIRANALYDIGDTYARERKWDESVEVFQRVRQDYSGFEDWYTLSMIGLGSSYEQLGQLDKAKEAYGVIAQLRADDDYGKTAIARLKRIEGKKK